MVRRDAELPMVSVEGRVPPHDLDCEAAVLSAIMIDPLALDKVLEFLKPEHFYSEAHRRIYEACVELRDAKLPVDVVQVGAWLKSRDRIAQIGGMSYLTEVLNAAPAVANVGAYGRTVTEKWRVRQVIVVTQRITAKAYIDYGNERDFLESVESEIYAVARAEVSSDLLPMGRIAKQVLTELGAAAARGEQMTGTPTGFDRYDRMTAGLHDGDLTIIAARPGMGKTSWVANIAINVASPRTRETLQGETVEEPGVGVCFFSLEMPAEQITSRMLCCEGKVDLSKFRTPGYLGPQDWQRLTNVAKRIHGLPIWIDDKPAATVLEIRAKVRRKQAEYDDRDATPGKSRKRIGLVVVDYIQLMRGDGDSREQEVSGISRDLKSMAKELRVPVVALAQLNREAEKRTDKRPQLSDLRESGALEQDADTICFIYRDDYYNPDSNERNIAELLIAKQRSGPTGTAKVRFDREYTRFDNLAEGDYVDDEPGQ